MNFQSVSAGCSSYSPLLQQGCGCHTKYTVKRPNCGLSEDIYWCSSDLSCNNNICTGSIVIGSNSMCKLFPINGYLLLEEYEGCGVNGTTRKQNAYLGDSNGNIYNPINPIVVKGYKNFGIFDVSSDKSNKLTFFINRHGDRFGYYDGVNYYDLVSTTNICIIPAWNVVSISSTGSSDGLTTVSTIFNLGCECKDMTTSSTYSPTSTPTYPTSTPTYPTNSPTYPTNSPTYPTNSPTWPTYKSTYAPTWKTKKPTYRPYRY